MKPLELLILALVLLTSCSRQAIQNGDLVFVDDTSSDLTKAINDVTQKNGKSNYTHIGICRVINEEIFVYHASTKKDVVKESLKIFLNDRQNSKIDVFRIKSVSKKQLEYAFTKADTYLGKPYDFAYIYGDDNIYCSELIYEIFKQDSIFKLNPMTFKNPKGEFHENWLKHYQNLNVEIPEGELGCNPNDMSKNSRLNFIKTISLN